MFCADRNCRAKINKGDKAYAVEVCGERTIYCKDCTAIITIDNDAISDFWANSDEDNYEDELEEE